MRISDRDVCDDGQREAATSTRDVSSRSDNHLSDTCRHIVIADTSELLSTPSPTVPDAY